MTARITTRTPAQRRLIIDDLAKVLRKPSAAPTITPGEVIALALNGTMWIPGRPVEDGDMVIFQIIRLLKEAGYEIRPKEAEKK
jgi:hypothetical protein